MSDIGFDANVQPKESVVLFTNYYRTNSDERQAELNFCLEKNLECKGIETIVLLCESGIRPYKTSNRFNIIQQHTRPKYSDIFNLSINGDGINILCNADIFHTDESIKKIRERMDKQTAMALSRWDWHDGHPVLFNHHDSQDTWIWKGLMNKLIKADFEFGRPGCDNRIAHELSRCYNVINPSKTIKTFHVHKSSERTYTPADTIPPPYKLLPCIA